MKYKMICIDMDGTLLNKRKKISSVDKEAIKRAHDIGVEIVVTTGRLYNNAAYFSQILGVDSPVIAGNGAVVMDKKNNDIIYECYIPEKECNAILNIINKYKTFYQFNTNDSIYVNRWITNMATKIYMSKQVYDEKLSIKYKNVESVSEWRNVFDENNGYIAKCIVATPIKSTILKIRDELNKIPDIVSYASGSHSLEINYKGVSKGNAVSELISKYGIKKEELICIGDNENDISMIKFAGLGVAMENAINEVKEVADYITDSNKNNGVAKVINKFIFNDKE